MNTESLKPKNRNENVEIDYSNVIEYNGKHAFDFYDPIKGKLLRFVLKLDKALMLSVTLFIIDVINLICSSI